MRRFVFCVRVPRTWQPGGEKAKRESTKKNRPNFRWDGFLQPDCLAVAPDFPVPPRADEFA